MKLFFCDTETTGLSSGAAIIQFSGIYTDTSIGNEVEFDIHIKPHPGAQISQEALNVNGYKVEDFESFTDYVKAKNEITKFFKSHVNPYDKNDKMHFVAWNGLFDWDKLNELFIRCGDKFLASYFSRPEIDLKQIVNLDLLKTGSRPGNGIGYFNLEFVMNHYGIEKPEGNLHDSLVDIRLTKKIWDHFFKFDEVKK